MSAVITTAGRVVVGTDASPTAGHAVAWAAHVAEARKKILLILMVLEEGRFRFASDDHGQEIERRARIKLDDEAARVKDRHPDLPVETALVHGEVVGTLVEASEDADLVVVGARGESAPGSVRLLGGYADAVVTHAQGGKVAVVPEEAVTHDGPVVVGVDDSPEAAAALEVAFQAAARDGRTLVAVYGVLPTVSRSRLHNPQPAEIIATLEPEVDALVGPVAARHPAVEWERRIILQHPVWALVEASEGASMVVVGSRGRGGFTRMLLGSTSRELLRHAVAPVVVVRPH